MEEDIFNERFSKIDEVDRPSEGGNATIDNNEIVPVFMQLCEHLEQQNTRLEAIHQELEQSRNDFESLFENAPFAYVVVNRAGETLSCNVAAKKLLYCAQDNTGGLEFFREVVLPEKQSEFDAFMLELKSTKTPAKLVSVLINRKTKKQLEVIIHGALNKPFESGNILLSVEDLTEKNKAVRELKQNENAISTIGEHITDLLLLSDLEGNVEYASPACKMLEYTEAEMLQLQLFDFVHPDDLPELAENFTHTMAHERTGFASYRVVTKTGNSFWVEANGSVVYDEHDKAEKAVFVVRDINKQKETENALVESENRFRSLFGNKHTPMLLIDLKKLRFVDVNPAGVDFFGFPKEELLNMDLAKHTMFSAEELAEKIELAYKFEKVQFEMQVKRADGKTIEVEILGGLTELRDEEVFYAVLQDVSERLQAKKQLLENAEELHNLNITKDKLFGVIAHDLRNPIGSIMTLTELISKQPISLSPKEVEKVTDVISKTAKNTFELLENLLDWSKIQRGIIKPQLQIKSIATFIDEVFEKANISAFTKKIKLIREVEPEMKVKIDSDILETILRNLLTNAIKFSPRNSTVWVHARLNKQKRLVIEVRDEGIGMDDEMMSQLFKLDTAIGRPGLEGEKSSGLGLIICKDYAALLKGNIYVNSLPNKGSSFFVELPQ
ncbi:MAG: PAS domain-containing sensor histidine kinase [Bacteroidales bacterium]|nr:PAS domain-containing sensor histidine kinase [Bacteroidales bacterium]